jgi:hypothetical protein
MRIHSPDLQALLRSVIVYYPAFNLKGNKMEIRYPFNPLMHYYNYLVTLKMKGKSNKPVEERLSENTIVLEKMAETQSKALDGDTLHALDVLLAYLETVYLSTLQPEESRYREGFASWRLLWFLLKPGSDVYARVDGKLADFVEQDVTVLYAVVEGTKRERAGLNIICWRLAYKSRRVMKEAIHFIIPEFIGEREISSLPVFPCTYIDTADKGKPEIP